MVAEAREAALASHRARTRGTRPVAAGARRRREDVQALRALAVLAVIGYHYWPDVLPGGFIGVDVFFVISGYLVGGALITEAAATGRIDLRGFFARRARRILPAALVVILVTVIVAASLASPLKSMLWGAPWGYPSYVHDAIASILQVSNLLFAELDLEYDASLDSPFLHFWSLGVEAQFYLVMPFVAWGVSAVVKRSGGASRVLEPLILTALAIGLLDLMFLTTDPGAGFYLPWGRFWEFIVGALVATIVWRPGMLLGRLLAGLGWAALVCGTVVVSLQATWPNAMALVPVLGSAAVLLAARDLPTRRGVSGAIVGCGDRSYSLYLVHWPALVVAGLLAGGPIGAEARLGLLGLTVVASEVLYRFVEAPGRALPVRTRSDKRRTVALLALAAVAVSAAALIMGIRSSLSPTVSDRTAERYVPALLSSQPSLAEPTVPSNVRPSLLAAAADTPAVRDLECYEAQSETSPEGPCVLGQAGSPVVVLLGDSHADQWYPALSGLADRGLIELRSYVRPGCSPLLGMGSEAEWVGECSEWLEWALSDMSDVEPSLVVISSKLSYAVDGQESSVEDYVNGIALLAAELPAGAETLFVEDTPRSTGDPAGCLADHVMEAAACAIPVEVAFPENAQQHVSAAAEELGIPVLSLTDYLCTETECPVILGDTLVYRDDDHLTATFAEAMAPVWEDVVLGTLDG